MSTKKGFTKKTKEASRPAEPCKRSGHMCADNLTTSYLVGGCGDSALLSDLWVFDKTSETWSEVKQLKQSASPFPRTDFGVAVLRGVIYLFGGMLIDEDSVSIWNDLWEFNIDSKSWRVVIEESICPERYGHAMVSLPEGFLIHGGECNGHLGDLFFFNNASRSFVDLSAVSEPKPCARSGHSMVCVGSKVVMFGGSAVIDGDAQFMNDIWVLDIQNSSEPLSWRWSPLICTDIAPSPREGACLAAIGSTQIMVFGGYGLTTSFSDNDDEIVNNIEKLLISEDSHVGGGGSQEESSDLARDVSGADSAAVSDIDIEIETENQVKIEESTKEGGSALDQEVVAGQENVGEDNDEVIDSGEDEEDEEEEEEEEVDVIEYLDDVWVVDISTGDVREVDVLSELPLCRGAKLLAVKEGVGVVVFGGANQSQVFGRLPLISSSDLWLSK